MSKTTERPLDHTTARVVAELTAALLPSLQDAVAAGLKKAAESLPEKNVFEDSLASLRQLREAAGAMTASLDAAREALSETAGRFDDSVARLPALLEESVPRAELTEEAQATAKLLRSLEASLPAWEGILKADGRAQTRELNEFSSEISELVRGMSSGVSQSFKEAAEKALAPHRGEWGRVTQESARLLEKRIARLERRVTLLGGVFAVLLTVIAITLSLI